MNGKTKKVPGKKKSDDANYLAPIVALVVSVVVLVVMVPAWRSSAMLYQLQRQGLGATQTQAVERIDSVARIQSSNIQVEASLADMALRVGAFDYGLKLIAAINRQDPRSVDGNYLGANAYEALKNYRTALTYRQRLLQLDPWSTRNMLQMVTDYVALKDLAKAREIVSRLSRLYPNNPDTASAQALVKG